MCTVMNLYDCSKQIYTCTPEKAVIAAYAQSKKDWNSWQYEERYSHLLVEGKECVACEQFSAFKDGRDF